MKEATPRMKALLAGAATVLVFGVTIPAQASADREPGKPAPGSVGQANDKQPPGQGKNTNERGYKCDDNAGAGQGNPALGTCDTEGGTEGGSGSGTDWAAPGS